MATVNFSVPNDVKKSFDRAFAGSNKSAVVAQLLREAVEERRRRARRRRAIEQLLRVRRHLKPVAGATVRAARRRARA